MNNQVGPQWLMHTQQSKFVHKPLKAKDDKPVKQEKPESSLIYAGFIYERLRQ